jgi:hypothetical protein
MLLLEYVVRNVNAVEEPGWRRSWKNFASLIPESGLCIRHQLLVRLVVLERAGADLDGTVRCGV